MFVTWDKQSQADHYLVKINNAGTENSDCIGGTKTTENKVITLFYHISFQNKKLGLEK